MPTPFDSRGIFPRLTPITKQFISVLVTIYAGIGMSIILNAILVWADTPGIEILEMTDSYIQIDSPKGTAIVTLKEDTYEVASPSEQLKAKIEEIIERALAEEKALWKRGHEFYTGGFDV